MLLRFLQEPGDLSSQMITTIPDLLKCEFVLVFPIHLHSLRCEFVINTREEKEETKINTKERVPVTNPAHINLS